VVNVGKKDEENTEMKGGGDAGIQEKKKIGMEGEIN